MAVPLKYLAYTHTRSDLAFMRPLAYQVTVVKFLGSWDLLNLPASLREHCFLSNFGVRPSSDQLVNTEMCC